MGHYKWFWSRKWQPTLVSLPGKFHGQRRLAGYSPWGSTESDTTVRREYISAFDIYIRISDTSFEKTLTAV